MPYSADNPMGYGAPTVQEFTGFMPGDQFSALNQPIPSPLSGALRPDYDVLGNALSTDSAALPGSEFQAATPEQLAYQNADASTGMPITPPADTMNVYGQEFDSTTGMPITPPADTMNVYGQTFDPATGQLITPPGEGAQLDSTAQVSTDIARGTGSGVIEAPGIGANLKTAFGLDPGTQTPAMRFAAIKNIFAPQGAFDREAVGKHLGTKDPSKISAFIKEETGFLRTYGPAVAAGLGVMALAPAPEQPELMDLSNMPSGQDLIDADPGKYRIYGNDYVYQQPNFTVQNVAGQYGGVYGDNPIFQPTALAAKGGIMDVSDFPRRNGGIAGPGTETSDDIPAMLSDGEFVFTAQAVRGAGKGSREDGMKNMYQMMRQFEARA